MKSQLSNQHFIAGVFHFIYNIPPGWIDEVWKDHWLKDHLKKKWEGICNRHDGFASANAILAFAGDLDGENMRKFTDYIESYINTKQEPIKRLI